MRVRVRARVRVGVREVAVSKLASSAAGRVVLAVVVVAGWQAPGQVPAEVARPIRSGGASSAT